MTKSWPTDASAYLPRCTLVEQPIGVCDFNLSFVHFADYLCIASGKMASTTAGVVDELREMEREAVPDVDDQEEKNVARGKFGPFN